MFLQADADLAARDPGLPGLPLLLDQDAFRETLHHALPGHEIGAVTFQYIRYKPGTNSLSAFSLDRGGTSVRGYAKAHQPDDWSKLMKAEQRPGIAGPLGPARLILPSPAIEVVFFPNDNKLKQLGQLFQQESRATILARVFRDRPDLQGGTIHQLRYKPERRFVGRLDIDGAPYAVLKMYSQRAYTAARTAAETFGQDAGLIGHSSRHGVLAFEWQHGAPLLDSISGPGQSLAVVERAGAALAEFHSRGGHGLDQRDRVSELATIQAIAESLRVLLPLLQHRIDELAGYLVDDLRQAPAIFRPIHGDFYDRQVLVDGDDVVILDLDEAVLADPAADLGLFIAHLERDALSRGVEPEHVAPARDALLAGYGLLPERVELYTAFGLLQLAPHHFRNREPDWPERTEATLERALKIVAHRALSLA